MEKELQTSPSLKLNSFYSKASSKSSKTWLEKQAKWQSKCEEFAKKPIPVPRVLRLDDPFPVFKRFPLQKFAFDFARSCSKDVHMFSEEIDLQGKRRYLVSTFDQFWQFYRKLKPEQRNYYEVITEGSACKLYFDLEFKREFNTESNGNEMLDIWIKYVCVQLKQHFGIVCDRKHIIDLDSSTNIKFSRHLIFCLPGAVFKDNIHVGNFVNHICGSLLNLVNDTISSSGLESIIENQSQVEPNQKLLKISSQVQNNEKPLQVPMSTHELKKLLVTSSKGEVDTFCDQGVYTKNRNFRLFKSTKYGKNSTLELSNENLYKPDMKCRKGSFCRDSSYAHFLDSLICNVSHSESKQQDVKILTFESDAAKGCKRARCGATVSCLQDKTPSGYDHSPYPRIDDFIATVINKGGIQGTIRRWVYFSQGKVLIFDIEKNRWCENIGRPHKSNHIIIVADMKQGVYYQKCYDPDCQKINYKSQENPIPKEINPFSEYKPILDSDIFEDDQDDDILCQTAEEVEKENFLAKHTSKSNYPTTDDSQLALLLDDDTWWPWENLPHCERLG